MGDRSRVLVFDDDDMVRAALVRLLSRSYRVTAVGTVGEALAALAAEEPAALISDLNVVGSREKGEHLLRWCAHKYPDCGLIIYSGESESRVVRSASLGHAFLTKNESTSEDILAAVEQFAERIDAVEPDGS